MGAYTPQIPTIDMVVNTAWADDIEMATDNGLLISTDDITPATIRKPLERLVGKDASVQMLDVASRLGLDPDARLTAVPTGGTLGSVVGTYTYRVIGGGRIAPDPSWAAANIGTEVVPILGSVTCHRDLFPQLRAALLEVQQRGLADAIDPDEYAGCYYPRFIAGTTTLSNHSFGLALDLNVPRQRPRDGRRDEPRRGGDLQDVGLRVGRRLALHRPDALRAGRGEAARLSPPLVEEGRRAVLRRPPAAVSKGPVTRPKPGLVTGAGALLDQRFHG